MGDHVYGIFGIDLDVGVFNSVIHSGAVWESNGRAFLFTPSGRLVNNPLSQNASFEHISRYITKFQDYRDKFLHEKEFLDISNGSIKFFKPVESFEKTPFYIYVELPVYEANREALRLA